MRNLYSPFRQKYLISCFVEGFLPSLGRTELEREIVDISATLEIISNATTNMLRQLQTEIKEVSQIALESCLALDTLLAAQGGVCVVINHSCCVYVSEQQQLQTDIKQIWQASHLFQVSQDAAINSGLDFCWLV